MSQEETASSEKSSLLLYRIEAKSFDWCTIKSTTLLLVPYFLLHSLLSKRKNVVCSKRQCGASTLIEAEFWDFLGERFRDYDFIRWARSAKVQKIRTDLWLRGQRSGT